MWSAVCSVAPQLQFKNRARPYSCTDEQKRPTPERRQLSLTQDAIGKPIPIDLVLTLGVKTRIANIPLQYSKFHFVIVHRV